MNNGTNDSNNDNVIPLPALPNAEVLAVDAKFRGITEAMDKAIDKLHKHGKSMAEAFEQPCAVLPVPTGRFPAGRVYLFTNDIALVVAQSNSAVVASMPTAVALRTLHGSTPDVLARNPWAAAKWLAVQQAADYVPQWHEQCWHDRFGNTWTVRLVAGGALVVRNGVHLQVVADDEQAEALDLHPVLVEIVADLTDPAAGLAAA